MLNRIMFGGVLLGTLLATLPIGAQAGFGFGFDSDNGIYDYDRHGYRGYRDYNPAWRWGSEPDSSDWRWGSKRSGSGWRWGDAVKGDHAKRHERDQTNWWHSRRLKDDNGWSSWGREWSFGRESDEPVKLNFGSFDWGDHWSPSFGKKSWTFGHKPRWYPGWGYPPAAPYPGWGPSYAAPRWGANPYGVVVPYPPQAGVAAPPPVSTGLYARPGDQTPDASSSSSAKDESQSATPTDSGSSPQPQPANPKGPDSESR